MSKIRISHPSRKLIGSIPLPGSKSESNRALILRALSGCRFEVQQLSEARDTQQLQKNLASEAQTVDVLDAGTSMRFLTAYYAATNQHKIITGSERMQKRPIAPLVNALNEIGFEVHYLKQEGFPPLEIRPLHSLDHLKSEVFIEGHISSQFITALLLIAPFLPNGLTVRFLSPLVSVPYIEMTLSMLQHFGVKCSLERQQVAVPSGIFNAVDFQVGADWSAASYWYSMAFLSEGAEIFLEGLQNNWLQGDQATASWMKRYSVLTEFTDGGALIRKVQSTYPEVMKLNYADNPDLVQTFATMFAAKNVAATFSGIESLRIKETDRVLALQQELSKCGYRFDYSEEYHFYQLRGKFKLPEQAIRTYNDHRMAMSFASLALLGEIEIEEPEVVQKSYPGFWKDMERVGFGIVPCL